MKARSLGSRGVVASLTLAPIAALAVGLGEAQLRSGYGQPLDVRIALMADADEQVDRDCFSAPGVNVEGVRPVPRVTLALESEGARRFLRATTYAPVRELAVAITVRVACAGTLAGRVERGYVFLVDPPPLVEPPVRSEPVEPVRAAVESRKPAPPAPVSQPSVAAAPVETPKVVERPVAEKPARPAREKPRKPRKAVPRESGDFVLKLSRDAQGMSRPSGSAAQRAELLDRQRVLDDDDRVSAILSLRRQVAQLEAQLAQLQLRLDTSTSLQGQPAAPAAAPAPAPAAIPPAPPVAPAVVASAPPPSAPAPAAPRPEEPSRAWTWALLAVIVAAILGAVLWLRRRRANDAVDAAMREPGTWALATHDDAAARPAKAAAVKLDATRAIAEARGHYERGAVPQAIQALEGCIDSDPAEVRAWLALFELLRAERLAGRFADLARRFHERHGDRPDWRKLCALGAELDALDPLYAEGEALAGAIDPLVENWMEAPFKDDVMAAAELHEALVARAGGDEADEWPALGAVHLAVAN